MAESSRRAARPAAKGGAPNALFLVGAAEAMPAELAGVADLVTIAFPWGSLLRGCLGRDARVAGGVASLLAPGAVLELLLAPSERDRLAGLPTAFEEVAAAVAGAFAPFGLTIEAIRPATETEIASSRSTWARRLLDGGRSNRPDRRVVSARLRSSGR